LLRHLLLMLLLRGRVMSALMLVVQDHHGGPLGYQLHIARRHVQVADAAGVLPGEGKVVAVGRPRVLRVATRCMFRP